MEEEVVAVVLGSGVTLAVVFLWLKASAERARSRAVWLREFYEE